MCKDVGFFFFFYSLVLMQLTGLALRSNLNNIKCLWYEYKSEL